MHLSPGTSRHERIGMKMFAAGAIGQIVGLALCLTSSDVLTRFVGLPTFTVAHVVFMVGSYFAFIGWIRHFVDRSFARILSVVR